MKTDALILRLIRLFGVFALGCLSAGCSVSVTPRLEDGTDGGDDPPRSSTPDDSSEAANVPPTAVIDGPIRLVAGKEAVFDGSRSVDEDGRIVAFQWELDDGRLLAGAEVAFAFEEVGSYSVTLRVYDDGGGAGEATITVIVEAQGDSGSRQHQLVVSIEPPGSAEVSLDPPGGTYAVGDVVVVMVAPATGYEFVRFAGDADGIDPTIEVVIDGELEVLAILELKTVVLSLEVDPPAGGTVAFDPQGGAYPFGTSVTVTAASAAGYVFEAYLDGQGALLATGPAYTLELREDLVLIARFRLRDVPPLPPPQMFALLAGADPPDGGTIQVDPAGGSYPQGTVVTLTAAPARGYVFVRFEGDVNSTDVFAAFTMDADKSVTAVFEWAPAVGNPGNLVVSGFVGGNVTEFDRYDGTALGVLVPDGSGGLGLAGGLAFGPDGDLFVVNVGITTPTAVLRYDGMTGAARGTFATGSGNLGF